MQIELTLIASYHITDGPDLMEWIVKLFMEEHGGWDFDFTCYVGVGTTRKSITHTVHIEGVILPKPPYNIWKFTGPLASEVEEGFKHYVKGEYDFRNKIGYLWLYADDSPSTVDRMFNLIPSLSWTDGTTP